MEKGCIKLHRSIKDLEWMQDRTTLSLFINLLLHVNSEDKKWKGIVIPRGSMVTSIQELSAIVGVDPATIRRGLDKLIESEQVSKQTTNKYTLITIVNKKIAII